MQSKNQHAKPEIVIVGAGPSGASLAIRLAKENFRVTLTERERFPRRKLCGEFISPECFGHFRDLEILNVMLTSGGDRIRETVFYELGGKSIAVPSKWFGAGSEEALSLSRAQMDFLLLEKAKEVGVKVLEETQAVGILLENDEVCGVKIKNKNGETTEVFAGLTIDATGRANVLSKLVEREISRKGAKQVQSFKSENKIANRQSPVANRLVGFKAHLKNVNMEKSVCEIYSFRGGYGGLSFVENNLANHCFLINAEIVKQFDSDAERIVREVVFQNKRAAETLKDAVPFEDWLAVSVEGFGQKELNPAKNLFAVGDAGAFIDPFTGSGMLMALESAEILAKVIFENSLTPEQIAASYKFFHNRKFQKRLFLCSMLRRAAFVPSLAKSVISTLSLSASLRKVLARSTRQIVSASENK